MQNVKMGDLYCCFFRVWPYHNKNLTAKIVICLIILNKTMNKNNFRIIKKLNIKYN